MKVSSVTISIQSPDGELTQFDFCEEHHKQLHLLVKDGQVIPNYVEGGEQVSYAYPVNSTIVRYTRASS